MKDPIRPSVEAIEDLQKCIDYWGKRAEQAEAEIERLRAALEPFQRNVESVSLSGALGHIGREQLWQARLVYAKTREACR
jgi:plasmid stabilization system protein ParE